MNRVQGAGRWMLGTLMFWAALAAACSSKKKEDSPPSGKEPQTGSTATAPTPEPGKEEPPAKPASPGTPATVADASFLGERCVAEGFEEAACTCAVEKAAALLSKELLEKVKDAPEDDDPKLVGYFSANELNRTMKWIETADEECGMGEAEEEDPESGEGDEQ